MSDTPSSLEGLAQIRTASRSDFDPLSVTGSSTIFADDVKNVISFVQDILVISPQAYWYVRDGKQENIAIGAQFDVSLSKKLRAVSTLLNGGPAWMKNMVRFLPTLALGGAFTPFESATGGVQSHGQIDITTPSFLLSTQKTIEARLGITVTVH